MSSRKSLPPFLRLKTSSASSISASDASVSPSKPRLSEDGSFIEPDVADDETPTNMAQCISSRPLSVSIPRPLGAQGPYCPRRPNLADILANNAAPPWTLSAFMAFLSQNHCLETLEFTMDVASYRKHYNKMAARSPSSQIMPGTEECSYVLMLWHRLVEAYIAPNGAREVNLPSDIRDGILEYPVAGIPPHPSTLDPALQKVHELMEDSVLVPFLNSFYPQSAHPDSYDTPDTLSTLSGPVHPSRSYDERAYSTGRRQRKGSPPISASSPINIQTRPSAQSSSFAHFARSLSHSNRHGPRPSQYVPHSYYDPSPAYQPQPSSSSAAHHRHSSAAVLSQSEGYYSGADSTGLSEDVGSSPSALGDPVTPPATPPASEFESPVSVGHLRGSGTWKKMRMTMGLGLGGKKKGGGSPVLREEDGAEDG